MTNFIPVFPLGIVVYPGENLNLHIFEPRYKQLIRECHAAGKPFGIPAVIDKKVQELGAVVEITAISKEYPNGEMDIRTKGLRIFRILELVKEIPDKLYSGAIVTYPENELAGNPEIISKLMISIRELHLLLRLSKEFPKPDAELLSYDVAHHTGLSLEQEYELLGLAKELQRLEFIRRHVSQVIPLVSGLEQLKEKIKLNGHFKNLSGFDL